MLFQNQIYIAAFKMWYENLHNVLKSHFLLLSTDSTICLMFDAHLTRLTDISASKDGQALNQSACLPNRSWTGETAKLLLLPVDWTVWQKSPQVQVQYSEHSATKRPSSSPSPSPTATFLPSFSLQIKCWSTDSDTRTKAQHGEVTGIPQKALIPSVSKTHVYSWPASKLRGLDIHVRVSKNQLGKNVFCYRPVDTSGESSSVCVHLITVMDFLFTEYSYLVISSQCWISCSLSTLKSVHFII